MSSPSSLSVNDGIDNSLCSLSYVGITEAVRERGTRLAKVYIKCAYRNVPVHPEDRWLTGMLWRESFIDFALPFGLRSAPKIFTALADAADKITRQEGVEFVIHYLDDFLVMGRPGSDECEEALSKLLRVFYQLGFPVAESKFVGPTTCMTFLGFELDKEAAEMRLSESNLMELKELLQQWQGRRSCTPKELESLIGKLGHAAQVVIPGKTFLRRMFELRSKMGWMGRQYRLNAGIHSVLL